MTSLPAPQEASHSHLDWPCEAVLQALEDTDLLTPWLGRRIEAIVAADTTLDDWQHQHFAQAAHELFLELGSALDRLCLSVLQSDDPHLAQEWFFKLQDKEATFPELASQSLGSSRDSGGRIGPLRQEELQPPLDRLVLRAQTGVIQPPLRFQGNRIIVLRLDSRQPARWDDVTRDELVRRLHRRWLTEVVNNLLNQSPAPGAHCSIPLP